MAQLNSTNILGNLAISGNTLSSKFIKLGGTDTQVLLANGDIKEINGTWPISVSGNAATATEASKLKYGGMVTTQEDLDGFLESNILKTCTWNSFTPTGLVSNGIILSGGWTSTNYGFQLAFDDDPTYGIYLRQKNSTWADWKRIPMGDGTGASGTWPISVSGNAATATKATNDANNAAIHATYVKLSECSNAGNRESGKVVTAAAAGQINSDKYLVTSSGTGKVTLQYNSTYKALEFSF